MAAKAYVTIRTDRCKSCMLCVSACARGLIAAGGGEINSLGYAPVVFADADENCKGCKLCAEMCPDCCIEVYRPENTGEKS